MMFAVGKSMENCEKFTPKILRFMSYLDCLINCRLKHRMELQEMFIFQSKSSCVYNIARNPSPSCFVLDIFSSVME